MTVRTERNAQRLSHPRRTLASFGEGHAAKIIIPNLERSDSPQMRASVSFAWRAP